MKLGPEGSQLPASLPRCWQAPKSQYLGLHLGCRPPNRVHPKQGGLELVSLEPVAMVRSPWSWWLW